MARRAHRREPVGAPLLRIGAEIFGRSAGGALVAHVRRRRLYLFLQRSAFAVRRHHPLAARSRRRPPARPALMGENDRSISLLERLIQHAQRTAQYSVYYGEGPRHLRRARTHRAREHLQHQRRQLTAAPTRSRAIRRSPPGHADWRGRCAASPSNWNFSTRSPGRTGAMRRTLRGRRSVRQAAEATCDFYIENTPPDGIPYWDTGAPGSHSSATGERRRPIRSIRYEPVDSSAAAIAAQGLLRLGRYLKDERYWQAGLTVCDTLSTSHISAPTRPSGTDPALGLSPAERLGSHSAEGQAFLRRSLHVGRLSRARTGAVSATQLARTNLI